MSTRQVRLPAELLDRVNAQLPKHVPLHSFCAILIEEALTGSVAYPRAVLARETINTPLDVPEPCVAGTVAVQAVETAVPLETSFSTERNSTVLKKRKKTVCTDEFNAFWKLYQSCPLKANTQRKTKAWDEWRKAIKIESPERLTEALENAIGAIRRGQNVDGWAAPLPDCFRWLRDGCYTAALEDNPAQDNYAANGITFLS
jgi:hypothetical protein